MNIKVCGINKLEQALALQKLGIDFIGFIFYPLSKRYVADYAFIKNFDFKNKVGVFVNEELDKVLTIAKVCKLSYLQLHGTEVPKYCHTLQQRGYKIIKAISINSTTNIQTIVDNYATQIDYYLFDTFTDQKGGSGQQFDWTLLEQIKINRPFFLSGGIGLEDVEKVLYFKTHNPHLPLIAIDINSKFEVQAGIKNVQQIETFKNLLKDI